MNKWIKLGPELERLMKDIPEVIIGLIVFVIGWIMAIAIRIIVVKILEALKFNVLCDKTGISEFLRKGQLNYTPSQLIGVIIYWITLILAFFVFTDIAGIDVVKPFIDKFYKSMPNIISAVFILIIGIIISGFVSNFVNTIASNAGFLHNKLLSRSVYWILVIFVMIITFESLEIASKTVISAFQIMLGAVAFGIALSFGIGCKDIARDIMERFIRDMDERSRKGPRGPDLEG